MQEIITVYSITVFKVAIAIMLFLYLTTAALDFVLYLLEGAPCRDSWKKHSSAFTLASLLLRLFLISNVLVIIVVLIMSLIN